VTDTDTKIVFSEFQKPGLRDDTYTISAHVLLSTTDPQAPTFVTVQQVIEVGTPAETIPADSVASVFPPDGESGHYMGHLPHVVLSHASLPWHKIMEGGTSSTPWLALLLITDEELRSANVTLSKDSPKVLTLKPAFFQSIAPSLGDLDYLAHVRRVDTLKKVDSTEVITDYALIVGNRLPPASTGSNIFLVPLHNHADVLPGGGGNATADVQLPVLYAWRFFTQPDTKTFGAVVSSVNCSPATLRLPDDGPNNVLAMGYVPMPHGLRAGGQTVSWYRGPFLPYRSNRQLPKVPIQTADAVTFYDPTLGMMDVSCSAAWMLGRLMALNAGSFAAALYNWKRATQRVTLDQIIHELDTGALPPPGMSAGMATRVSAEQALSAFLPSALAQLGGHAPVAAPVRRAAALARPVRSPRGRLANLRNRMTNTQSIRAVHGLASPPSMANLASASDDQDTDPQTDPKVAQIWSWLGDLTLFKGVPLFYLAADERMLPAESIRFFHVDQSWLTALIDGALSIGRVTASDLSHDDAFHPMLHNGAAKAAAAARPRRRGVLADSPSDFPLPPARPISGFFLRSSAVTSWPGLQVDATGPKGQNGPQGEATILRMDAFGTLLVCLFDRDVIQVKLSAPPEGVHFGFEEDIHLNLTKKRRSIGGDNIGSEIDDKPITTIPYRGGNNGVLDVKGLAKLFADSFGLPLRTEKHPDNAQLFTAAEFALQMVAGVDEVTFTLSS
jgi:hypothetical protein